jgi:hypothetical protein
VTPAALLREAAQASVSVRLSDGKPRVGGTPSPELLARLRAAKAEITAVLAGDRCRHCGTPLSPTPAPRGSLLVFADGTAECMACADREVGRLFAAGCRAVASPDALADPAEVMLRGEIDP